MRSWMTSWENIAIEQCAKNLGKINTASLSNKNATVYKHAEHTWSCGHVIIRPSV